MPFPLTLNASDGSAAWQINVPTSWADVTLAQFGALFVPDADEARVPAEILCDLPAGTLGDLAMAHVGYLANLLAFAADPSPVLELLPTPGLPDIGTQPYGIFLLAQEHIGATPDRPWLAYGPYLLALYRVQLAYGKYSEERVAACLSALLGAPVTESYADASFFLSSYKTWLSGTPQPRETPTIPTTKKSKRARKSLANGSGRFSDWMRRLAAPS